MPVNYSIPRAILDILLDFDENFSSFAAPYQQFQKSRRYQMLGKPELAHWRYNRAMRYLEQRGQIEMTKEKDKIFIKLTKKGKLQALLDRIKINSGDGKKWDGKWRMVIWDIPESSHRERNRIRYFLKNLGFYRLQFSVFIRPYPIPGVAVDFLRESGLLKFIRFLRVDKVDEEGELLKYFKFVK